MKYATILIFYSALCIFLCMGGTKEVENADKELHDVIDNLERHGDNVLTSPDANTAKALSEALASATVYLIGQDEDRALFKISTLKKSFMDTSQYATYRIMESARNQSNYAQSLEIMSNAQLDARFYAIADKLKDKAIIDFLRSYFEQDPIMAFKIAYHLFVYQWMLYEALRRKQESPLASIDDLIIVVLERLDCLFITKRDPVLIEGLQKEQDILKKLLVPEALSNDISQRTIYLGLVRDYMFDIPTIPNVIQRSEEEQYKVLKEFSERQDFKNLSAGNPLREVVRQELARLNPDHSEALLIYITTLNTTLTSLRNSISG